ncbi:MAG TPA: phosphoglycerate mutase family protein [Rhizomicrobium sp.]|nr:phosphoglycerate mutase family protein [Rhizomicrobium sp.]
MPPALTWLIRHGQSASNAGLPATGYDEIPLTELGQRQAQEVAARVERQPDLLITSKFLRASATAEPIIARWPLTRRETWPIQELTYLSPARCRGTTPEMRRPWIEAYWDKCDPDYLDGPDAESFRSFMARLRDFHQRLFALDDAFVVVIGHGQFFRACELGLAKGFAVTGEWMKQYRAMETANPMANGEIVELTGEALARCPA